MATLNSEEEETNSSSSPEKELDGKTVCSPCDADGKKLEAVGYCKTCKEFLCKTCFKYHRLPSLMRQHVLLDREEMGSVAGSGKHCPEHKNRAIECHCPTHSFFGCHACLFQHQKTCKDSLYIPDVAENFHSSCEFKEFNTMIDFIGTKIKGLIADAKRNSDTVTQRIADGVSAIKAFKLQVIEAAKQLEKKMISKADHLKQEEMSRWEDILNKCISIQDAYSAISTEIEVLKNKHHNGELYLVMVSYTEKVKSMEIEMKAIEVDTDIKCFAFEGNADLLESLKRPSGFGKLVNAGVISSAKQVTDINVKFVNDSKDCCIRGSVVMPGGKLVIGDKNNKNVKLVDTRDNTVVAEIKLSNEPWSVAKVTDSTIAVTVPIDKKIVFVRTDPTLILDRELMVKKSCYGVAHSEGKLVVTYCDEQIVALMDMQGTVLREIKTDDEGETLFRSPSAVAVDPDNKVLYVSISDFIYNSVKCLTMDGSVVAIYKDNELKYPHQAVFDNNGMVLVCTRNSHNVHLMTSDCKNVKVLLSKTDGLINPETISYDEFKRKLYVGVGHNLKVYHVKYSSAL